MNCSNCYGVLEDTFLFCPRCGTERDKSGGIDDKDLGDFLENRKKTIDVLERVIRNLETTGKIELGSSLVSSGANITSAVLWLAVPTKPVAAIVDVVASGIGIANTGVCAFTALRENGLLNEANAVCKIDNMTQLRLTTLMPLIQSCRNLYRISPKEFQKKLTELRGMCKSGKFQDCSFRPTPTAAKISLLANFTVFLAGAYSLYRGNYSRVAGSIKEQRDILKAEYDLIYEFRPKLSLTN